MEDVHTDVRTPLKVTYVHVKRFFTNWVVMANPASMVSALYSMILLCNIIIY